MSFRRSLPVAAILVPAALVPVLVYSLSTGVMVHLPATVHLVTVGAAGALAGATAIALSVIAVRLNDGRAVLLGFAVSVMSVLLVLHALATPGVLIADNGLVQAAGALNIPLEEFDVLRSHPGAGRELLAELGGFPPLVLDLVESHHERLDGRGYPNRADARPTRRASAGASTSARASSRRASRCARARPARRSDHRIPGEPGRFLTASR